MNSPTTPSTPFDTLPSPTTADAHYPPPSPFIPHSAYPLPIPNDIPELEQFNSESFEISSFLSSTKHLALSHLMKLLLSQNHSIKSKIIDYVNVEYVDFINLSLEFNGLDDLISVNNTSIKEITTICNGIITEVKKEKEKLEGMLKEREELREKRVCLMKGFVRLHNIHTVYGMTLPILL